MKTLHLIDTLFLVYYYLFWCFFFLQLSILMPMTVPPFLLPCHISPALLPVWRVGLHDGTETWTKVQSWATGVESCQSQEAQPIQWCGMMDECTRFPLKRKTKQGKVCSQPNSYSGFCSMEYLGVLLLPLDGMLLHHGLPGKVFVWLLQWFASSHLYSWRERE